MRSIFLRRVNCTGVFGALSTSSTTGTLIVRGPTPLFSVVSAFASGIGAVAAPSLVAQTTPISSAYNVILHDGIML